MNVASDYGVPDESDKNEVSQATNISCIEIKMVLQIVVLGLMQVWTNWFSSTLLWNNFKYTNETLFETGLLLMLCKQVHRNSKSAG